MIHIKLLWNILCVYTNASHSLFPTSLQRIALFDALTACVQTPASLGSLVLGKCHSNANVIHQYTLQTSERVLNGGQFASSQIRLSSTKYRKIASFTKQSA